LHSTPTEDVSIPVGSSKLGGDPDTPTNFDWPSWDADKLALLLQVNLADIAHMSEAALLPQQGLLSFFYHPEQLTWGGDPEDKGSWQIYYFETTSELVRTPTPELNSDYLVEKYPACSLHFEPGLSYPNPESEFIQDLKLSREELDVYIELYGSSLSAAPHHQLFGCPYIIQRPMEIECEFVTNGVYIGAGWTSHPQFNEFKRNSKHWLLLLQLDSDDNARMMWGDAGMLYFWIKDEHLREKSFAETWMILQCY
jgi:uncharacterized protein YwqG